MKNSLEIRTRNTEVEQGVKIAQIATKADMDNRADILGVDQRFGFGKLSAKALSEFAEVEQSGM